MRQKQLLGAPEMEATYQFFINVSFLSVQGNLVPDLQTLILDTADSFMEGGLRGWTGSQQAQTRYKTGSLRDTPGEKVKAGL